MSQGTSSGELVSIVVTLLVAMQAYSHCDWPRVDGLRLRSSTFRKTIWERTALVITNLSSTQRSTQQGLWTIDRLVENYGQQVFDSSMVSGNNRKGLMMTDGITLQTFLQAPDYNASSWFVEPHSPMVRAMVRDGWFFVPRPLKTVHREGPFLSLSRKGQYNGFHAHENSWFAQVLGTKRWFLLAPNASTGGLGDFELNVCKDLRLKAIPHCDLEAGQILYVPSKFVHATCTMEGPSAGFAFIGSPRFLRGSQGLDSCVQARMGATPYLGSRSLKPVLAAELLFLATAVDNIDLVQQLQDFGADLQMTDARGRGPLALAVEENSLNVARHLSKKLRLVHAIQGQSLLHLAASEGHVSIARHLIKRRLDPSTCDDSPMRNTPVSLAAWHGHVPMLNFLSGHGGDLAYRNAQGLGPGHLAALESYYYVIDHLLKLAIADVEDLLSWGRQVAAPESLLRYLSGRLTVSKRRSATRAEL